MVNTQPVSNFFLHHIKTFILFMTKEQLERLLDTACNIIISLEDYADESLQNDIEALFQEILHSDNIEDEIRINYSDDEQLDAFNNKP